jgi:hypothetical protein
MPLDPANDHRRKVMARSFFFSEQRRSGSISHFPTALKPRNKKKSKRKSWGSCRPRIAGSRIRLLAFGLATIGAAALAVVVLVVATGSESDDVDPAHKILELTAQDIDPETTAVEKNLLKEDRIDARLAAALWRDARRQLSGTPLKEAQRALGEGLVNPAVEPLMKQLAADFGAGKAAAFTIWVAEDESQPGNAVDLRLDGVPLGKFSIEQNRYAITVVERTGQSIRLQITGASDANRGAVFRAETATSEAKTRHLTPGRNDNWRLVVK